MKIGTVTGAVWSSRKAECLMGQTFLSVRTVNGEVIASDHVGAGPGDKVLLVQGSAAARFSMEAPTDAAIVAILDPEKP